MMILIPGVEVGSKYDTESIKNENKQSQVETKRSHEGVQKSWKSLSLEGGLGSHGHGGLCVLGLLGPGKSAGSPPIWFQLGSQDEAKMENKSMQKSIKNLFSDPNSGGRSWK